MIVTEEPKFSGIYTAIATPFTIGGEIDYGSLERLLEFQIKAGVDGVVVAGSSGESVTLGDEEYRTLVRYVHSHINGRVKCIAGIGSSSTARAVEGAEFLKTVALDGVLMAPPPYNKPTQEGIIKHFEAVKAACGHPLIAYNIPGRTAVAMQPGTIARMVEAGTVAALKDSTGSIDQMLDLRALVGDRFPILSGEDSLLQALMACGGKGAISASANLAPKMFKRLVDAANGGDFADSREIQMALLPLIRAVFMESNPIPVKAGLKIKGVIDSDFVRLPLTVATPATVERLSAVLREVE